jgi:hypothetical protein
MRLLNRENPELKKEEIEANDIAVSLICFNLCEQHSFRHPSSAFR